MQYQFVKIRAPHSLKDNFWELNEQVALIEPFRQLYENDASSNKEESSKIAHCIWLMCDPNYENKVYRLPHDQKKSTILYYNPAFDFNDDLIKQCIASYDELLLTPAAKAFKIEEASLIKRAKFLEEAEYTFPTPVNDSNGRQVFMAGRPVFNPGTAKDIDMMRKGTAIIVREYEKAKKVFEEEQKADLRVYGGGTETSLDKGYLMLIEDED